MYRAPFSSLPSSLLMKDMNSLEVLIVLEDDSFGKMTHSYTVYTYIKVFF